ncbi:MAG: polysaccharide pyruvyl transferase family protein [Candidatus Cloacimonadales bacterium]
MKNVAKVAQDKLCHGCGICQSICPTSAIKIVFDDLAGQFLPVINPGKCTACGLCLQVCSGNSVDQVALAKSRYPLATDPILGHIEAVYISSSQDPIVRQNAASGGTVTTILKNLFQAEAIEAALIAQTEISDLANNSAIVIENPQELENQQSSNYTNIPLLKNISEIIAKYQKLAIVALPCQVHALRQAIALKESWQKNDIFIIGLLCGGVYKAQALQRQIQSLNLSSDQIEKIAFRQGKWPGKMRLTTKTGKQIFCQRGEYFLTNYLRRCFFCNDFLNEFADISLGDNWLKSCGEGENIIIIRAQKIQPFLQNLNLKQIEPDLLYQAYRLQQRRNKYFAANSIIGKLWRWPIPEIKVDRRIKAKFSNYYISFADSIQFKLGKVNHHFMHLFFLLKNGIHHHLIKEKSCSDYKESNRDHQPKSKTILISEADVVGNKGAVAMLELLIKHLRRELGDLNFIVTSLHRDFHPSDPQIKLINTNGQAFDLALAKAWSIWLLQKIGLQPKWLMRDKILQNYLQADLIISASGISFNEDFGLIQLYHYSKYIQIPLFLGKPIIKFTQTLGPFNSRYNLALSKALLPNINFIFARGNLTAENLMKIGVEKNVKKFPDIAFTLPIVSSEKTEEILQKYQGYKIVCISPNIVCQRLETKMQYLPSLVELCRNILQKYPEIKLMLLPHTIAPETAGKEDDLSICQAIYSRLPQERVSLETEPSLSPSETKALIAASDFLVASRFHAIIAGVSAAVPTISLGWHWKYRETMQWLAMDDLLLQYWELTPQKLWEIFQNKYAQRDQLHQHLQEKIPQLKAQALESIQQICEVLK